MGIDFIRLNGEGLMDLNTRIWSDLFDLAIENGWEPMGTVNPYGEPCEDWCGTYFSSDFQTVTVEDLANMCDVLERGIQGKEHLEWVRYFIDEFRRSGEIMLG